MAVDVEKDDAKDRVVRDTIPINKFMIHILFDSGCTHSFIAHRIVKKLGLLISTLPYPIIVTAAKGEPEYTTLGVKKLEFEIQGATFVWDFILYGLRDYDVILGMDWLSSNKAFLDCERKRVLRGPCKSDMELIFQGSLIDKSSCIVTCAQAQKLIAQ